MIKLERDPDGLGRVQQVRARDGGPDREFNGWRVTYQFTL